MRQKFGLNTSSTTSLYFLSTLPERDQTRVVAQLQSGVAPKDLQSYIIGLKNLSEEVKNAVLRTENPISIKDANYIERFKPEEKKDLISLASNY